MEIEFITGIWLAKFGNETELTKYVDCKHSDDEDGPGCKFANDIGLNHFDHDFFESAYLTPPFSLLKELDGFSFVENFKEQLLTSIGKINYIDKNSIISLSGKKDVIYGGVNDNLFDFVPKAIDNDFLQFVGLFRHSEHRPEL
jgi:hypothetical protein